MAKRSDGGNGDIDWSEDDLQMLRKLGTTFLPMHVEMLVSEDLLDPTRLDDREYVLTVAAEHSHLLSEITVQLSLHSHFIESAARSVNENRMDVAVVLICTALEHVINLHHDESLARLGTMSEKQIKQAMEQNHEAKLGWMISMMGAQVSESLRREVAQVFGLRNKIVHYKPEKVPFDSELGWHQTTLLRRLSAMKPEELLSLPPRLEHHLQEIRENRWPEIATARLAVERPLQSPTKSK